MPRHAFRHDDGPSAEWVRAVGRRLLWARELVAESQTHGGKLLGTTQSTMGQYERGDRLLPPDKAMAACRAFGVSMDYLYLGRIGGHMRRDIEIRLVAGHPELLARVAADHPSTEADPELSR
jgi:transcriptional regulator with XRE-family HTH domain